MKKITLSLFLILANIYCYAQVDTSKTDTVKILKPNPIVYLESYFGASEGLLLGASLNYQLGKHQLFTARFTVMSKIDINPIILFIPSPPLFDLKEYFYETGALYGYRTIGNGHSFSFSLGVSYTSRSIIERHNSDKIHHSTYFGVPWELNANIFNKVKRRYRIVYGLIPVTKPTAFGRSIGLKLIGNLSQKSYIGGAITLGLGYYKVYER